MLYPNIAPRAEPAEQINANLKALDFKPKHRAINNTSGGIGKNEASTNGGNLSKSVNVAGVKEAKEERKSRKNRFIVRKVGSVFEKRMGQ